MQADLTIRMRRDVRVDTGKESDGLLFLALVALVIIRLLHRNSLRIRSSLRHFILIHKQ